MKKFFAVAIALMMVLSLGVFAADYEVDIPSITDASSNCIGEHDGAQFNGTVIMFHNGVGVKATLGEIDLSKYSKVVVEYGSDPNAIFSPADSIILKDADGNDIGSFMPSVPTGFWGLMTRTSEIALNTDYNGKVVLFSNLTGDGISICNITFVEKSVETEAPATEAPATEAETEAPATEAPATEAETEAPAADTKAETKAETNDAETKADDDKKDDEGSSIVPIIIIAAVVVVAAVAVAVIMKKKK